MGTRMDAYLKYKQLFSQTKEAIFYLSYILFIKFHAPLVRVGSIADFQPFCELGLPKRLEIQPMIYRCGLESSSNNLIIQDGGCR